MNGPCAMCALCSHLGAPFTKVGKIRTIKSKIWTRAWNSHLKIGRDTRPISLALTFETIYSYLVCGGNSVINLNCPGIICLRWPKTENLSNKNASHSAQSTHMVQSKGFEPVVEKMTVNDIRLHAPASVCLAPRRQFMHSKRTNAYAKWKLTRK